jgi:hypothetical protein
MGDYLMIGASAYYGDRIIITSPDDLKSGERVEISE